MRQAIALVAMLVLALTQTADAAVAVRQTKGTLSGASGTQTTIVLSGLTTPLNGDLMLVGVTTAGGHTVTTLAGWTLLSTQIATDPNLAVFGKIASGEGTSYTFTVPAGDYVGAVFVEFTGTATTLGAAISQYSPTLVGGTTSNVITTTSLTPTSLSNMPVAISSENTRGGVTSVTAGWTGQYSAATSGTSGNGFVPDYDGLYLATGPLTTDTVTSVHAVVTWNLTSGNGPTTEGWGGLVAPPVTAKPRAAQSFPVNASTWGFRRR